MRAIDLAVKSGLRSASRKLARLRRAREAVSRLTDPHERRSRQSTVDEWAAQLRNETAILRELSAEIKEAL